MIALVGVENIAVVETKRRCLFVILHNAQGVKDVVEQLKASNQFNGFT